MALMLSHEPPEHTGQDCAVAHVFFNP